MEGCQSPRGGVRAQEDSHDGRSWHGVGKLVTYWGIDELRKSINNNRSQLSHCGKKELQIWKGRKLE